MVVTCEQVWQEISNYLENDIDSALRAAMDEHFRECKRCSSVLEGTKNVVELYGDERLFRAPLGYSWRLHGKLAEYMPRPQGTARGWLVAVAAIGLIVGGLGIATHASRNRAPLLSQHAQPGRRIPKDLAVLVTGDSKVFHVAGCPFIHDKDKGIQTMTAAQAEDEGYVPCVRCLGKYLLESAKAFAKRHGWLA